MVGPAPCHVFSALRRLRLGVRERPEPAFEREFGLHLPGLADRYAQAEASAPGYTDRAVIGRYAIRYPSGRFSALKPGAT